MTVSSVGVLRGETNVRSVVMEGQVRNKYEDFCSFNCFYDDLTVLAFFFTVLLVGGGPERHFYLLLKKVYSVTKTCSHACMPARSLVIASM